MNGAIKTSPPMGRFLAALVGERNRERKQFFGALLCRAENLQLADGKWWFSCRLLKDERKPAHDLAAGFDGCKHCFAPSPHRRTRFEDFECWDVEGLIDKLNESTEFDEYATLDGDELADRLGVNKKETP